MINKKNKYAVFIGRFQPFHVGHLHNIKKALSFGDYVILIIGSSFGVSNIKDPFSYEFRRQMILSDLKISGINTDKIIIEPARDFKNDEHLWETAIRTAVYSHAQKEDEIFIVGHEKDGSSYYLKSFYDWKYIPINKLNNYSATDFRKTYFRDSIIDKGFMISDSPNLGAYFYLHEFMLTKQYNELCYEFKNKNNSKL